MELPQKTPVKSIRVSQLSLELYKCRYSWHGSIRSCCSFTHMRQKFSLSMFAILFLQFNSIFQSDKISFLFSLIWCPMKAERLTYPLVVIVRYCRNYCSYCAGLNLNIILSAKCILMLSRRTLHLLWLLAISAALE